MANNSCMTGLQLLLQSTHHGLEVSDPRLLATPAIVTSAAAVATLRITSRRHLCPQVLHRPFQLVALGLHQLEAGAQPPQLVRCRFGRGASGRLLLIFPSVPLRLQLAVLLCLDLDLLSLTKRWQRVFALGKPNPLLLIGLNE